MQNLPKINYQKELDKVIKKLEERGEVPKLLLHSCCAPCSSYVLEYLSNHFEITVFYYNPNIYPEEEYWKRVEEQKGLIRRMKTLHPVSFLEGVYEKEAFYKMAEGMEALKEGGVRCFACYEMRLRKTAELAKEKEFDFFTTTLSISPMKNAQKLNEIGGKLAEGIWRGLSVSRILRKKKDTNVPSSSRQSMDCTVRITVVVNFP